MEFVVDQQTAYGLIGAEPHPVDGLPRAPEIQVESTYHPAGSRLLDWVCHPDRPYNCCKDQF